MCIIGISGCIGTGKSTLAEYLSSELNGRFPGVHVQIKSFAGALKQEVSNVFNYPIEWNYTQEGKSKSIPVHTWEHANLIPEDRCTIMNGLKFMSVRALLQWYGTDYRRAQDPNYWVKAWKEQANEIKEACANQHIIFIIDDVRFPTEKEMIQCDGCFSIRLNPYPGWTPDPVNGLHESETALNGLALDEWDMVVSPGYGELETLAKSIATRLLSRPEFAADVQYNTVNKMNKEAAM